MRGLSSLIAAYVGHIVVDEFFALIGVCCAIFLEEVDNRAIGRRRLLMMFTGGRPPKGR